MSDQLPAVLPSRAIAAAASADTYIVPAIVATLGDQASWRYVEFFAANIRNPNTRRAYARACGKFFAWCEDRGLTLTAIRPFDVGAWVERLQENHGAAGVKQQLAAVRMMFNWLVTGQVVPVNPAAAVPPSNSGANSLALLRVPVRWRSNQSTVWVGNRAS